MTPLLALALLAHPAPAEKWIKLFDGHTLGGWTAKIKGYDLGDNFAKTFRVVDGAIVVRYDGYGGKFDNRFGHLFYKSPYSSYRLQLDYRFVGEQLPDGPSWAFKNSGIMIHGQDPKTMGKDQDFPVSIEVQLLGGADEGERSTANMCSPGTNIVMGGKLITQHCVNSISGTFRGEQWVHVEVEVHGAGKIIHYVNGEKVMEYEKPQIDPNDQSAAQFKDREDLLLQGGSISLQSESHPVEFKNIELMKMNSD